MTTRSWKRFLVGAAVAGISVPGLALAEPTCAYVLGKVDGVTVATPAVPVIVPSSDAEIQPVRVHLDEREQSILGYSVRVPGAEAGTEGQLVYVPGISEEIPSVKATLPELNFTPHRCVNIDGVSTPAVPVYIPSSTLATPGTTVEAPVIALNIVGHHVTTQGHAIILPEKTVVIPEIDTGVPSVPVGTPNQSIVVDINGTIEQARYLIPNGT